MCVNPSELVHYKVDFLGLRASICAGVDVVVYPAQFSSYRDWRYHAKCPFIGGYDLHWSEYFQWRSADEILLDLDGAGFCYLAVFSGLKDLF